MHTERFQKSHCIHRRLVTDLVTILIIAIAAEPVGSTPLCWNCIDNAYRNNWRGVKKQKIHKINETSEISDKYCLQHFTI